MVSGRLPSDSLKPFRVESLKYPTLPLVFTNYLDAINDIIRNGGKIQNLYKFHHAAIDNVIDDINNGGKIQILSKKILAFSDNTQD